MILRKSIHWGDGVRLKAYVGIAGIDNVLTLPKDDNNNQISDAWLWDLVKKPKAADDSDNNPVGNGVAGDAARGDCKHQLQVSDK